MLKIKLARFGKRNQPHYRIVVNEARSKRDGQYVEMIGAYAPAQQPKQFQLDLERYDYWLEHGAQPTETVASLAKKYRAGDTIGTEKDKAEISAEDKNKKKILDKVAQKQEDKTKTKKE